MALRSGSSQFCTIYLGIRLPEEWNEPLMDNPDAFRTHLIEHELAHWSPRVLNFIRHSDGPFGRWSHYTMSSDSLSWESAPGVALVGDALHPTLPWPGEAMGTSLFDSFQLGQKIAEHGIDGMDQAVAQYEKQAFPRRKAYIEKCKELGSLFYNGNAAEALEVLLSGAV